MRRLVLFVWCFLLVLLASCSQQNLGEPAVFSTLDAHVTTELYFSEYVEGTSHNKALEIYNGTLSDVDLSHYQVEIYFNGNTSATTNIPLVGELASGQVFVLADDDAGDAILSSADQTSTSSFFNGDDAVVLRRNGEIVDSMGQVGTDPGSQWGGELVSTSENTLRRVENVCSGDTEAGDAFTPGDQWTGFQQDTFDGLGTHSTKCTRGTYASSPEPDPDPDPTEDTPIYEVQGSGASSPFDGDTVKIRGVVVGDFQEYGSLGGFFVQELEGDGLKETSDGIFVYHYNTAVSVGDEVEVTGEVDEYEGLTEITAVELVEVVGESAPQSTVVTLPLDEDAAWEWYEGMLITLESGSGPVVATEVYNLGRYGLVTLADERVVQFTQTNEPSVSGYEAHREELERRTILLDDGTRRQNPDPIRYSTTGNELTADQTIRVGDSVDSVTGVVTYSDSGWSGTDAYRIHPTEEVDFEATNPRPHDPPTVGGEVRVATFNVLNFFNGDGMGGGFPTPRGAYNEFELERQLDKLVSAIVGLDADVLGLVEIENDAGNRSALADLVDALNSEAGAGTYDYVDTGLIGTDEIKVAMIYQPAVVVPTGPYRVLNSTISNDHYTLDSRFDDSYNRPALAQTFVQKGKGARFTVVVNHLKSKGSACPGDGGSDDGQGNCNAMRTAAAEALADWSEFLAAEAGDPDVLITGDLNAYAMEDPIRALLGEGFENLLEPDEYTYVFMGESGTLDHALATPSLADQVVDAEVWKINTEEPSVLDYNTDFKPDRHVDLLYSDHQFRASDHDPVVIGLELHRTPRGPGRR